MPPQKYYWRSISLCFELFIHILESDGLDGSLVLLKESVICFSHFITLFLFSSRLSLLCESEWDFLCLFL
jgi:hypothetical protein